MTECAYKFGQNPAVTVMGDPWLFPSGLQAGDKGPCHSTTGETMEWFSGLPQMDL